MTELLELDDAWYEARGVMPFSQFPADMRERFLEEAAMDQPPAKWFYVGDPEDPRPLAMLPSRSWHEWYWRRGRDPKRRSNLPPKLRQLVIDRDGYVCGICGGEVDPDDVHIDHIRPVRHGGQDVEGNLRVTHSLCNMRRGARVDA